MKAINCILGALGIGAIAAMASGKGGSTDVHAGETWVAEWEISPRLSMSQTELDNLETQFRQGMSSTAYTYNDIQFTPDHAHINITFHVPTAPPPIGTSMTLGGKTMKLVSFTRIG